ncbi:RNA polymerase sigma factor [Bacillota bacterium]
MDAEKQRKEFFEGEILIHYEYLHKFLLTATKDKALAGDIVQETMARAWEKMHLLINYINIKYALRTMARNLLYNHYNKKTSKETILAGPEITDALSTEKDGLSYILKYEDRRVIIDAISKLPKPCMQVILLRYYHEQPLTEVAKLLDMNYNTVLSHHSRGIKALKSILKDPDS